MAFTLRPSRLGQDMRAVRDQIMVGLSSAVSEPLTAADTEGSHSGRRHRHERIQLHRAGSATPGSLSRNRNPVLRLSPHHQRCRDRPHSGPGGGEHHFQRIGHIATHDLWRFYPLPLPVPPPCEVPPPWGWGEADGLGRTTTTARLRSYCSARYVTAIYHCYCLRV